MADNIVPYVIPLSAQKPKQLTLVPSEPGSRYKTRQLQVQIVGKSKMMKTMLVNILDVARDMQVPPSYIGTFMGYEIGAQAKWDPKKPERQQAFLSGEHATKDLSKIALQFIHEVVLCPNCSLPEIVTEIDTAAGKVKGRCRACGGENELKISNEKFKRYILNHPPTTKGDSFSGNKNVDKKEAAVKKQLAKQSEKEKAAEQIQVDGPVVTKKRDKSHEDEIIWYSDTSEDAARQRREKMLPESFSRVKRIPEVSEVKEILNSKEKLEALQTSCCCSDGEFVPVLFNAIVPENSTSLSPLIKQKAVIKQFISNEEGQLALLNFVAKFCRETQPSLLGKVSPIIKELYDEELLDEENVFTWFDSETLHPKVKESAQPIVTWFKEAEEESGSEEED